MLIAELLGTLSPRNSPPKPVPHSPHPSPGPAPQQRSPITLAHANQKLAPILGWDLSLGRPVLAAEAFHQLFGVPLLSMK